MPPMPNGLCVQLLERPLKRPIVAEERAEYKKGGVFSNLADFGFVSY
jgi:hypothetical protein